MDIVVELTPVPSLADAEARAGRKTGEEAPQGLVRIWKNLTGGKGRAGSKMEIGMEGGDDLAFTLTRRRFAIAAYSLPPADGDEDPAGSETKKELSMIGNSSVTGQAVSKKNTKVDLEF